MGLHYEPKAGGTELHVTKDPQVLTVASMQDELTMFTEVRGWSDASRTALAQGGIPSLGIDGGFQSLEDFDTYLEKEFDRLADILDYFGYDSRVEQMTVRDGDWFVPDSVEDFSAENVGEETPFAIDGDNSTWWQFDGAADITFKVRDHKKMITGLRLRTTSGDLRCQLQGVDIYASQGIGAIDDPGNLLDSGIDFTYAGEAWMEHVLSKKKRARYLKLVIPASLNGSGHVRIREFNVRVGITNHDK